MGSFDILSEIIIGTLKEFSTTKRAVTAASLSEALASRNELSDLLAVSEPVASPGNGGPASAPLRAVSGDAAPTGASDEIARCFPEVRSTYLDILAELGPISKEEHIQRSSDLQKQLRDCPAMNGLANLGVDLVDVVKLLVGRTVQEMDYTSIFLAELSNDLSGMEQQLVSYHGHSQQSYSSNSEFCSHLLSHTEELDQAFASNRRSEDIRSFIGSKLLTIRTAIEAKVQEDEGRLREADQRIQELHASLRHYQEEVTQVTERADKLEKETLVDSLTGVHNRRAYELQIRESVRRFNREGQRFSLILIDVDRFKSVNDLYGHRTGDKCLREIARIIKESVRSTDFLARYGGEEFIAILPGSTAQNALKVAEKLRNRIEKTRFCFQDEDIPVTISLGVTETGSEEEGTEVLFNRVDDAMYRAKHEGRNAVCVG